MQSTLAFVVALAVYASIFAYWVWAAVNYVRCIGQLPQSKDRCVELAKIVLNKAYLAAVISAPATAVFKLIR